jgi:HEAT repeat protein
VAAAALRRLLDDPDPDLRKEAALALGVVDDASAQTRGALRTLLQDESAEVRQAAREAMLGSPDHRGSKK